MTSPMSSPASSTPGTPSRRSTSPIITPRSKVKAMLAAMDEDDSSDNEDAPVPATALSPRKVTPSLKEGPDSRLQSDSGLESESESESESEAEEARPRGKLASRMMGRRPEVKEAAQKVVKENAYARVRQSIFGGADEEKVPEKIPETTPETAPEVMDEDDEDDEDDVPVRRRPGRISIVRAEPEIPAYPSSKDTTPEPIRGRSRSRSRTPPAKDSEDELPEDLFGNSRFQALVAKKRQERQAKEAEEQKKAEERRERQRQLDAIEGRASSPEDQESSNSGEENLIKSQRAPTRRKAGKKALEEMHKETQRMARNMQLAHEARIRTKVTKQSLFDKFNFRPSAAQAAAVENKVSTAPDSSSTIAKSESEILQYPSPLPLPDVPATKTSTLDRMDIKDDTPLTPKPNKSKGKAREESGSVTPGPKLDKGKGKAIETSPNPTKAKFTAPPIKFIRPPLRSNAADDSDSDLEILVPGNPKVSASSIKSITPSRNEKMIEDLRRIKKPIHKSPAAKRNAQSHLTGKQLQAELLSKSRLQAVKERQERIEELKAKGVIVQTAEEREQEQKEVESLFEKARQEALTIKKMERAADKKEKAGLKTEASANEEDDDDEEDVDWLEEDEDEGCGEVIELSGSEDELEEEVDDDGDAVVEGMDEEGAPAEEAASPAFSLSSMVDDDRNSPSPTPRMSDMPAAYIDDEADDDSDDGFSLLKRTKKIPRNNRVIEDDDEMDIDEEKKAPMPNIPSIFQKTAAAPVMGLTQLFNGTSASNIEASVSQETDKEKMDTLRRGPREVLPNSQAPIPMTPEDEVVKESQFEKTPKIDLHYTPSKFRQDSMPGLDLTYERSQNDYMGDSTQMSAFPDPTQDVGFNAESSPPPPRFHQTQETAPSGTIPTQVLDSQLGAPERKRGKLRRRNKELEFSDEEKDDDDLEEEEDEERDEEILQPVEDDLENVFDIMKKAARKEKKPKEPNNFDKKNSGAKNMVEDQAEESEDEYAGIGGASDDEAQDCHDSEMEDMIDDETRNDVDESAIAAFYAEKEKQQDEKDVNKLFRDLQNGMLRKKRGAEFDLDDSDEDDDGDARRRARQRQLAKMRKVLLKDQNLEKIADDPKKRAFLKCIEDRDMDDEMGFLDRGEEDLFTALGGSQSIQDQTVTPEGERDGSKENSQVGESQECEGSQKPEQKGRRTNRSKKPSLAEVRETLSFLVEENASQNVSDSEGEEVVQRKRCATAVIDRVKVARSASAASESTRMAFQTSASHSHFRVPTLLQRTTNNNDSQNSTTSSITTTTTTTTLKTKDTGETAIKRGGKASSSINFYQREQARAKTLLASSSNKDGEKKKKALQRESQQRQSMLGKLTGGSFS